MQTMRTMGIPAIKRVVDGVSYNTATSTALVNSEDKTKDEHEVQATLFQTRNGAFFVVEEETWGVRGDEEEWEKRSRTKIRAMTPDQAQKWVTEGETELLPAGEQIFGEMPEAAAEAEAHATIYLRVPAALKSRIERAALKADQSVNVWAMRCFESCAAKR